VWVENRPSRQRFDIELLRRVSGEVDASTKHGGRGARQVRSPA
jgi:hypothetical protein